MISNAHACACALGDARSGSAIPKDRLIQFAPSNGEIKAGQEAAIEMPHQIRRTEMCTTPSTLSIVQNCRCPLKLTISDLRGFVAPRAFRNTNVNVYGSHPCRAPAGGSVRCESSLADDRRPGSSSK